MGLWHDLHLELLLLMSRFLVLPLDQVAGACEILTEVRHEDEVIQLVLLSIILAFV